MRSASWPRTVAITLAPAFAANWVEGANAAARTHDQHRLAGERLEQVDQGEPGATSRRERRRDNVVESTGDTCQRRVLGNGHVLGIRPRRAKRRDQQLAEQIVADGKPRRPWPELFDHARAIDSA